MTAPTLRERLAHRLAPHLAGQLDDATRAAEEAAHAAEHAQAANRATQGRLLELLRTDPDRFRQYRALQLLGAVLDRFHGHGDPVTARVSQANYSAWCATYDELSRPLPEPLVADREPDQPAVVHPATDSEVVEKRTPCGEIVRDCGDLDCGGCTCFLAPPCTHCMEHTCTRPELHSGDCQYDPELADA